MRVPAIAWQVVRRVAGRPLIIVGALGVLSAAVHFQSPVALPPLKKMPWEITPLAAVKLLMHPALVFLLLSLLGLFNRNWIETAVLMTALPPALNVFVFARQYDAWVEPASSAVLVGTFVSVLTLTTVM